jgi:hypothetical protein
MLFLIIYLRLDRDRAPKGFGFDPYGMNQNTGQI